MSRSKINEVDTVFTWQLKGDRVDYQYRIRIYWITWEKAIIIATDITKNLVGSKNIHYTKEIISFASRVYDLVPNKTMFIEHYPTSDLPERDTYLQVLLTKDKVARYKIGWNELTRLVDKQI